MIIIYRSSLLTFPKSDTSKFDSLYKTYANKEAFWTFRYSNSNQYLCVKRFDALSETPAFNKLERVGLFQKTNDPAFDEFLGVECYNQELMNLLINNDEFRQKIKQIFLDYSVKCLYLNDTSMGCFWLETNVKNEEEHEAVIQEFKNLVEEYIRPLNSYPDKLRLTHFSAFAAMCVPLIFFVFTLIFPWNSYFFKPTVLETDFPRWSVWLAAIVPTLVLMCFCVLLTKFKIIRSLVLKLYSGLVYACFVYILSHTMPYIDILLGKEENTLDVSANIIKVDEGLLNSKNQYLRLPSLVIVPIEVDGFNVIESKETGATTEIVKESRENLLYLSPGDFSRWHNSFSDVNKGIHVNGEFTFKKGLSGRHYLTNLMTTQDLDKIEKSDECRDTSQS